MFSSSLFSEKKSSIPVTFIVENTGIVDQCEVSVIKDLVSVFGEGNIVNVTPPVATGELDFSSYNTP